MFWVVGKKGQLASCFREEMTKKTLLHVSTASDEVDITNASDVRNFLDSYPISHAINTSAYTHVDNAEGEKENAFALNSEALAILATECENYRLKIVHFSTDYVFDGTAQSYYKESDKTSPLNLYGESKLQGEKKLLELDPEALVIRVSWLFSEHGNNFAKTMIRCMKEKENLKVVSDQIGRPTYAKDLVKCVLKILGCSGIYHFSNQEVLSRYDFALSILEMLHKLDVSVACQEIDPVTSLEFAQRAKRPLRGILDVEKIESRLGESVPSYKIGLLEMIKNLEREKSCAV